jgi:hypothetical protein
MTAPAGEYASWSGWLDAFGRGEDLPTGQLVPVDERFGPHAQARLLGRLTSAFHARQAVWLAGLERDLAATSVTGGATELGAALVNARRRAAPLVALAHSRLLPEDVRAALLDAVTAMLRTSQQGLEDSMRHGPAAVLSVIRQTTLLGALTPVAAPTPTAARPTPGRRVIL